MVETKLFHDKEGGQMVNALSKSAATRDVDAIISYWKSRGHFPSVWPAIIMQKSILKRIYGVQKTVLKNCYAARSDMVNGVPATVKGIFRDETIPVKALGGRGSRSS
tara:strand:- start:1939 stop:2259 length:321 start_codon:yes stop_codon:yes gene_type:complete